MGRKRKIPESSAVLLGLVPGALGVQRGPLGLAPAVLGVQLGPPGVVHEVSEVQHQLYGVE
ncbi:MAG TPA: hypothetical protein VE078_06960 [Thermoanaerobaculia bacterium]|nr:hypothetical protein [Thermoanaerobaculia bacterium]